MVAGVVGFTNSLACGYGIPFICRRQIHLHSKSLFINLPQPVLTVSRPPVCEALRQIQALTLFWKTLIIRIMISMRKPFITAGIFVSIVFCLSMAFRTTGAPIKAGKDKLPKPVAATLKKQIELFFGGQDFTKIPLLDLNNSWNILADWPEEIMFRGETFCLNICDLRGGDYLVPLNSKADVKPGMVIHTAYLTKGNKKSGRFYLSACWDKNGNIEEKGVVFNGKTVFILKYYPAGRVLDYQTGEGETPANHHVVYDANWNIKGFWNESGLTGDYKWRGRKIDEAAFEIKENVFLKTPQNK